MQPLTGIRVLDFSTLLPGPLATLILAEAGAEVIKIERPGRGDEMRSYTPKFGADSVNFALLNRGKRSIAIDLKAPDAGKAEASHRIGGRGGRAVPPGVMDRLGLGYDALRAINPRIVYCAITGYGQNGPRAEVAAHDLNYVAESGMLSLTAGADGAPVVPAALVADIAGGTYPGGDQHPARTARTRPHRQRLQARYRDGRQSVHAHVLGAGQRPRGRRVAAPRGDLVTGGSPRYNIYRTRDDRFLAAAPLEQKFWENFCELLDVPQALRDDERDTAATRAPSPSACARRPRKSCRRSSKGRDVCCAVMVGRRGRRATIRTLPSAGLFSRELNAAGKSIPALPVPVAEPFRSSERAAGYPALGEANGLLKK